MPSERILAEEVGVNYMTVRRAFQILEQENLAIRQPNGRMQIKRIKHGGMKHLNFAFLTPIFDSNDVEIWRLAIEKAVEKFPCSMRPVVYMHWDDPILIDALKGFDGVFLYPIHTPLPESLAEILRKPEHPVVVVDDDFSHYGLPSIQFLPPKYVQRLLDHLDSLGHKKIGCFNTQPSNSVVSGRIDQWRYWMAARGLTGRLIDSPVPVRASPIPHAYDLMTEVLSQPHCEETAWLCITAPAALGAMRAMLDKGVVPGRDMAICAVNGEEMAAMLNPRLTALEPVNPVPFFLHCLNWMSQGRHWQGPLLMTPSDIPLYIRESTQPDAAKRNVPTPNLNHIVAGDWGADPASPTPKGKPARSLLRKTA